MKAVRLWLSMLIGATLMVAMGATRASAQTASATPTPTPGVCSLAVPQPTGTPAPPDCRTGAEPPPSLLGVSGGNINSVDKTGISCCTGTFGAEVQDASLVPYVLSTNNALARTSGGTRSAGRGEAIVQPGLVDLGCFQDASDTVAKLSNWQPLNFAGGANTMDAAIAKVVSAHASPSAVPTAGIDPSGAILNLGQISTTPFPFDQLEDGIFVMKMGRGSCLTSGQIDAWDAKGKVLYPAKSCNAENSGTALFDHQILILGAAFPPATTGASCTFAGMGDSGALVTTLTTGFQCPQAIGILFAASPGAGTAFGPQTGGTLSAVTPIQTILSKFKVTLVGSSCTGGPLAAALRTAEPQISDARRASIKAVQAVKAGNADALLRHKHVTAVAIGSGDLPDTAALIVYVDDDSPATTAKIPERIGGVQVKIKHGGTFQAL